MVPWYNFLQPEGAEPEVYIGLYECHIRDRGYGPSAIDRAMTHTPMLLLDHERRFAASQLGIDCSNFESEHCENVSRAIEYSVRYFESNKSHAKVSTTLSDDIDLIGLAQSPTIPCYPSDPPRLEDHSISPRSIHSSAIGVSSSVHVDAERRDAVPSRPITIDDADVDEEAQEAMVELALQSFKESRKLNDNRPRQYVAKRLRRPQPKGAKVTNC